LCGKGVKIQGSGAIINSKKYLLASLNCIPAVNPLNFGGFELDEREWARLIK